MKTKTILTSFFALCIVAVVAVLMTLNTHSVKDPLLMENVAALATPHWCSVCGLDECECVICPVCDLPIGEFGECECDNDLNKKVYCWDTITLSQSVEDEEFYCGSCEWEPYSKRATLASLKKCTPQ